jgi:hypothetical protein
VTVLIASLAYLPICAGFGAYVATVKRRHWLEGAAFGLALGPFGVIALACMPTEQLSPRDRRQVRQDYLEKTGRWKQRAAGKLPMPWED